MAISPDASQLCAKLDGFFMQPESLDIVGHEVVNHVGHFKSKAYYGFLDMIFVSALSPVKLLQQLKGEFSYLATLCQSILLLTFEASCAIITMPFKTPCVIFQAAWQNVWKSSMGTVGGLGAMDSGAIGWATYNAAFATICWIVSIFSILLKAQWQLVCNVPVLITVSMIILFRRRLFDLLLDSLPCCIRRRLLMVIEGPRIMYHGTSTSNAHLIEKDGCFRPSNDGMLGRGVYVSAQYEKARNYGSVVFRLEVRVGKVKKIDMQGHPMRKTWHQHGYDSAWVPKRCGMVPSGLTETCVFDPARITIKGRC